MPSMPHQKLHRKSRRDTVRKFHYDLIAKVCNSLHCFDPLGHKLLRHNPPAFGIYNGTSYEVTMPNVTEHRNSILKNLDADIRDRLRLRSVQLPVAQEIEAPGDEIKHLIFLEDGIGSMTNTFADGSQAEVGIFGYESVMGASALLGTKRSLNKVYMQASGHGFVCSLENATREFRRFGLFHDLVLRYTQAQLVQTAQTAGCNAKHTIRQRLARWLLLSNDRLASDTIPLTQEFLSDMLGAGRPTVSVAADVYQKAGIILYNRGKIQILDLARLEKESCECYRVVRDHLNSYTEVEQDVL